MPVLCSSKCGKNAILKRPKTGDALCKDCFFWAFETEIHHSISKGNLFQKGQTVAIAASGGKDSTVLAYVLKVLNERYNYGLNLQLLSIDEGITGYRDDSLTTVKRNKDDYAMPLKVLSYDELYGWTMDAIVSQIGKKNNCTFCGVFRRQALDRGAAMLGVDVVATGHNADDIAETVIMNVLRGDIARLHRCTAISTESEGSIPRVKPLKYTYEKEIVMYAYFKKLVYFSTECVYAPNAYRGHAREYLKDLEKIRPTSILDVIHSGEQFAVKEGITLAKRGTCSRCGFVSSQLVCKACVLLEGLNKGLPKLCIGKSNKLSRMESSRLTLNSTDLKKEHSDLYQPSLDELTKVVYEGLKNYFGEVKVEVVDCPNLIQKPFNLACQGFGGNPTLLEVGGPPYLLPVCNRDKIYDLRTLVESLGMKQCFVVGAGAGPWFYAGKNCEMMANVYFSERESKNLTYIAKVAEPKNKIQLEVVPDSETRFALLANLFCCKGKPGKVLRVSCKKRTGEENFVSAIRLALQKEFQEKPVGLGGVFLIKSGKARHHVMPDFSNVPLNSDDELNKWLRFFELSAPLVAVGTLVSSPIQGLDLRLQHFHCFSEHGVGGHYHNDTTPQEVEYEGYFNLAECIYRVDKPVETHKFGRD